MRVQAEVDRMAAERRLPEPASYEFIRWLHREFYRDAPEAMLRIRGAGRDFLMEPGEWRSRPEHDVAVGRHRRRRARASTDFMRHFESRYRFAEMGKAGRIMALAAAHHRLNYIHPFPDGNGRVSRLMSHAMGHAAGIGAHGLWSISRGLARGLASRGEYKQMMDHADMPRQGDLDGRGNLSRRALADFVLWFLRVCLDQVTLMTSLFELETLARRLGTYVERSETLRPEAARLLRRGAYPRRVRAWGGPAHHGSPRTERAARAQRRDRRRAPRIGDPQSAGLAAFSDRGTRDAIPASFPGDLVTARQPSAAGAHRKIPE